MQPVHVVTVTTPQKLQLSGLWYGGTSAKTGLIFLHGLSSTAFTRREILAGISNSDVAVLAINNRGHDEVTSVKRLNENLAGGYDYVQGGRAHEVFTDCVDDIDGTVSFMRQQGVETIFLLGHSTGCQKSVYYLSKGNRGSVVKGAVLLCGVSDYAYAVKSEDPDKLKAATEHAQRLVADGKPHELLPQEISADLYDAQRFLSLNTPDSEEEIFSYSQPDKTPETLQNVSEPLLVIYAGNDEYRDRPASEIIAWFEQVMPDKDVEYKTAEGVPHNLDGAEDRVAGWINAWLARVL